MNWYLDVFSLDCSGDNCEALAAIQRCQEQDRSGPCEDDVEVTAPYIGILPDESNHEQPSPLNFTHS